MDYTKLAEVLRDHAAEVSAVDPQRSFDCESADLVRVLARILAGAPIDRAFGAPGDWGYNTPIGKALAAAYRKASLPSLS